MEKILIVEDSPMILKILRHLAEQLGEFDVCVAADYKQAVDLYNADPSRFFCALVDLNLPDAPKGEIVDFCLGKKLSTIVLTGTYNEALQDELIDKGIVDYILKENRFSYEYAVSLIHYLRLNQNTQVLVAEDSDTARNHIVRLLRTSHFQVFESEDGEQALETLKLNPNIKMVIADYHMPVMDGFLLVQAIRKQLNRHNVVCIGLSSAEQSDLSSRFIKYGADDFLPKPFQVEEFNCRIKRNVDAIRMLDKLENMAYEDFLTEIPNRRKFMEAGSQIYADCLHREKSISLVIMDIDFFKRVNDTYGHDIGDIVLKMFSSELSTFFKTFLYARTGGEEFAMIMPTIAVEKAYQLLEAFRIHVMNHEIEAGEQKLNITFSGGLSGGQFSNLVAHMQHADELLYRAKEKGRNAICVETVAALD